MTDTPSDDPRREYWGKQLADIDLEIVRQAMLCEVPLNDRSIIERVLNNDTRVCGKQNPQAFEKLRAALTMHFEVRNKAIASMGRTETLEIIEDIITRLKQRLGMPTDAPAADKPSE